MLNYLVYPFKVMRITQSYDGETSHKPHMTGTPKEYALDEGGKDTGRDWCYCPCDEMKVVRLTGVSAKGTNALYLTSTTKCCLADGRESIVTLQLVHPNDDDLKKLKVGQKFKRGEKICREGNDGASGYHIHMAVGLGSILGTGWEKNSKGKWVLVTTGGPIKPEDAFYIDASFTKVVDRKRLAFKEVPGEMPKIGTYKVTADALNVRNGTKKDSRIVDVITKGTVVNISKVKLGEYDGYWWGKVSGLGWCSMKYLKHV